MTNDRVHASLDGEIPREELSSAELVRLDALEAPIGEATAALRDASAPDLAAGVMESLPGPYAAPEAVWWDRFLDRAWRPRSVTIRYRPALAMAGLAAVALAAVVLPVTLASPGPAPVVGTQPSAGAARLYVQFRLEAPQASRVELAGSFTDWRPDHELREVAPGVWTALIPLEPGVHDYTFVVDGERWVVDPYAPTVPDSFGGSNSRLFLPPPMGSA